MIRRPTRPRSSRRRALAVASAVALAAPLGAARAADPQAARALRAVREDGATKVRARAAFVLARVGGAEAVPALRQALEGDRATAVRLAAAAALGRLGGRGAAAALRAAAVHDPDPRVRDAAQRALEEVQRGARTVALSPVEGPAAEPAARARLGRALAARLREHGFAVTAQEGPGGDGLRLKPAVLRQDQRGGVIEVRASLVAEDRSGQLVARVEGGARAAPPAAGLPAAELTAQACEAAARGLADDLARRLLDGAAEESTP